MDTTDDYQYVRTGDLDRVLMDFGAPSTTLDIRLRGQVIGYIEVDLFRDEVVLKHRTNDGKKIEDPIVIEYSPCHKGGNRPWFICPDCEERKTILFRGRHFRCRKCLGLTYASLHETKADRPLNRLMRQRRKLGGTGELFEPFPPKPRGMHWDKYYAMFQDEQRNFGQYLDDAYARLKRSADLVLRRAEKRSAKGVAAPKKAIHAKPPKKSSCATTPRKPTPAKAEPQTLNPEDLALVFGLVNLTPKRDTSSGS
jgi:hypothetical protein